MLVLPVDGEATLVVPRLEAPRVVERPDVFALRAVGRDRGPDRHRRRARRRRARPWPSATAPGPGSSSTSRRALPAGRVPPRERGHRPAPGRKDAAEIEALRAGRRRRRPGRGRSSRPATSRWSAAPRPRCRPTSAAASLAEGHHRVNFAIVAAGANAASPHHEPGDRVIERGRGRAVRLRRHDARRATASATAPTSPAASAPGEPPAEVAEVYAVLLEAQAAAVAAAVGRHAVRGGRRHRPAHHHRRPATASSSSTAPATASASRSTRTPTSWPATATPLAPGHAFSIEPGIYVPGRFGFRLEDIVVATDDGPDRSTAPTTRLVAGRRLSVRPTLRPSP